MKWLKFKKLKHKKVSVLFSVCQVGMIALLSFFLLGFYSNSYAQVSNRENVKKLTDRKQSDAIKIINKSYTHRDGIIYLEEDYGINPAVLSTAPAGTPCR